MKRLLTTLVIFIVSCPIVLAQFARNETPAIGSTAQYTYSLDGRQFVLSPITAYESFYDLPFGLDFSAGWGGLFGTETLGKGTQEMELWYGVGVWVKKEIGGDGFFLGAGLRGITNGTDRSIGLDFFAGWQFNGG